MIFMWKYFNGDNKMIKKIAAVIILLIMVTCVWSQNFQKTDMGVKSTINSVEVEIQFFNPSTVRVLKSPEGKSFKKESLSVIEIPKKISINVEQKGDDILLTSERLKVKLNLLNANVCFFSASDKPLLIEKENSASFKNFDDAGDQTYSVNQSFVLDKDEAIYGLGIQQQGKMIQRNLTLKMVQGNTDDYVPFFLSVKGYGLFWDNYSPTTFTDNSNETSFNSEVGDCIDYYFMFGGNADGVIAQMRNLTGQAPMFPLWTYGY